MERVQKIIINEKHTYLSGYRIYHIHTTYYISYAFTKLETRV